MKFLSLSFLILLASCSTPGQKFQERFEQIPLESTLESVEGSFGRPNMIKKHSEDKIVFFSLIAYRIHGLFCIIYFDEGKTYEKGICKGDDTKVEYVQDTSASGKAFRDVWVPINNNNKELVCSSFTDMFKVTFTTCE